jgi:O-antigen ligase
MMAYPILGVGPTNFGVFSGDYEGLDKDSAVHNLYLQTGSDCGFLGLGLLLTFYFVTLRIFASAISWKGEAIFKIDPVIAAVTTGAFAGVVGYLVHSCFSSGVIIETPYLAVMLGAAAVRLSKKEVEQKAPVGIPLAAVANA